jgi:anti-anti-sigma factor
MPATNSPAPIAASGESRLQLTQETDAIVAISLEGEFDMANAHLISEQAEPALNDRNHLILDLSQATFIDSSTIRVLYQLHDAASKNGQTVVLQLATAAIVDRAIQISGIEHAIRRASSRTEAIQTILLLAPTDERTT